MQGGDAGHASSLYVWNGMSLFWGTSFHTRPHHHDTLQLVFDIDKQFLLKDRKSSWQSYSAAIIRAMHTHQLDSNNSVQLFIYLDRDCDYAQRLEKKYLSTSDINNIDISNIRHLSNDFFKRLLVTNKCDELFMNCMTILDQLIDLKGPVKRDERVDKAIDFINKAGANRLKIEDIANHVCLSESRLRFLFKQQVGQPIQNFMLWLKVVNSVRLVLKGHSLSESAQNVGFWDGSHMNKSYKEILGVAPTAIRNYEHDLKVISCKKNNFYSFKTEVLENWLDTNPSEIIIT